MNIDAWIGLGKPVDLVCAQRPLVVVERQYDFEPGQRAREVASGAPQRPGVRRAFVPLVHGEQAPSGRGPLALSPSGVHTFQVALKQDVGEIGTHFVSVPVALPQQPIAAAVSDAKTLWISLADGRLLIRDAAGEVSVSQAQRYAFMQGGPGQLMAAWCEAGLFVHDASGALRAELPIRSAAFALRDNELLALEANGPVWVHRIDLAARTHAKQALTRSVDVLAMHPRGLYALTRGMDELLLVDLASLVERPLPAAGLAVVTHAAFDAVNGLWMLGKDAEHRWCLSPRQDLP